MKHPENLEEHLRFGFELMATLADGLLARFDVSAGQIEEIRSMVSDFKTRTIPAQQRVMERLERIEAELASLRAELSSEMESESST